jgi:hypothetical protein
MIAKRIRYKKFPVATYNAYPPEAIAAQMSTNRTSSHLRRTVLDDVTLDVYRCHRGIAVRSSIDGEQCLCSPAYLGEYCQYQSERISIVLNIELIDQQRFSQSIYKLLVRVQTKQNTSFDSMEIYHAESFNRSAIYKQVFYLRAPRL